MTSTFTEAYPDTRIFAASALGSLVLHGLIIAGLANMPKNAVVKEDPPTVQVTLLPTPEVAPTPPASEPSIQPQTATPQPQALPAPQMPLQRSQAPVPPRQQATRTPTPPPLTPPTPAKPILKDMRASKALKTRNLMKMRVPTQRRQTAPSMPTVTPRTHAETHAFAQMPMVNQRKTTSRALPAPPTLMKPQMLTAPPSKQTGPTMTRPTIISSSKPVYPRVARESGWEGTVILRILIDTNGVPNQVKIRKSCGHQTLDQAAQDAVMTWTFQPAKDGNIPISKWVDIPIKFDLNS